MVAPSPSSSPSSSPSPSPRTGAGEDAACPPTTPAFAPIAASVRGDGAAAPAWAAAAAVVDPEVPCVTVADLGILRAVEVEGRIATARLTPTYSGCPAVLAIELAVASALREAGFEPRIERVLSPAWTTDWITAEGRSKLLAFGIAPPARPAGSLRALFAQEAVACPRCGSEATERVSEFGSTACKALWRCRTCAEPFDYFKCL